jgi:hypothetical protein
MRTRKQRPYDPEAYARWRATIPFTDEAIAQALDREAIEQETNGRNFLAERYRRHATWARAGHVTGYHLRVVLYRLITLCAVCGQTALYRLGSSGRCRLHRQVTEYAVEARRFRLNVRSAAIDAQMNNTSRRAKLAAASQRLDQRRRARA